MARRGERARASALNRSTGGTMLDRTTSLKISDAIDGMKDELVQLGLDLGNIESPTGKERAAGDYVYEWMARHGFVPERIGAFEDRFNVVGRVKGTGGGK